MASALPLNFVAARPLGESLPLAEPCLSARAWGGVCDPASIRKWDRLARRVAEPNPFFESWFLLPSLRAFDPACKVRLLILETDGEWLGLMPLRRETRYYGRPLPHLSAWQHSNCFLGLPLIAAGQETAFWRALLAWADGNAGAGLFLHLRQLPLESQAHKALEAVLAEQNRTSGLVHREDRAMLASALSPGAYFEASLSGKKRKELRRQFNRLSDLGTVDIARQSGDDNLSDWTNAFLHLEARGWKGKAGSAMAGSPATASLFREALQGAAQHSKLERLTITLDGAPIAMLASFLSAPGAFSFKTAYDEDYARFSPGVLLQRENLAILQAPGIEWCDSCAAPDHPMIDHIWRERRAVGHLSVAIGGKLRRRLFGQILRREMRANPATKRPMPRTEPMSLLTPESRDLFAASYPEVPHKLLHSLHQHPLLEFERLAQLAEALPEDSVEYNLANLPIAVNGKPDRGELSIGDMIRQVGTAGSWAVLQNIEQDPEYAALLNALLDKIVPEVESKTGKMMHRVGFIFVTSPGGVTPCHFDPEHNILLQIRGSKVMTQFPASDTTYASDQNHEDYHTGGPREVPWNERLETDGTRFALTPGEGLFVPVMSPHFVKNGQEPSISLSITWRSEWSYEEADARAFNKKLRLLGLRPKAPGRWPQRNRAKAFGWRVLRKFARQS